MIMTATGKATIGIKQCKSGNKKADRESIELDTVKFPDTLAGALY